MSKFNESGLLQDQRICNFCKNYRKDNTCLAFPDGIPVQIWNKHDKIFDNQKNDIVFEPINEK